MNDQRVKSWIFARVQRLRPGVADTYGRLKFGFVVAVLAMMSVACGGCHDAGGENQSPSGVANQAPMNQNETQPQMNASKTARDIPRPSPASAEDPNRWLHVLAVEKGAEGGWATGSFHEERNMLEIQTKDVTGFAVDVNRIDIDWTRPVVLSINSRRSELRKRAQSRYHFVWQKTGWVVLEPPVRNSNSP